MKPVSFLRTAPRARGENAHEHSEYVHPLSLDAYLITHPASTYFVRAAYPPTIIVERGITHGDILLVDRAVEPRQGSVVLIATDGDMELREWSQGVEERECAYWGTVTALVRTL